MMFSETTLCYKHRMKHWLEALIRQKLLSTPVRSVPAQFQGSLPCRQPSGEVHFHFPGVSDKEVCSVRCKTVLLICQQEHVSTARGSHDLREQAGG